jgi:HEAT repeat protein
VESYDLVTNLLESEDPLTRETAVRAMQALWKDGAFEPVVRLFKTDTSAGVRKQAGWTLRSAVSAENWHVLFELWRTDLQPRHREWACELAGSFGTPEILIDLEHLTKDLDGHVRQKAFAAVEQIQQRKELSE